MSTEPWQCIKIMPQRSASLTHGVRLVWHWAAVGNHIMRVGRLSRLRADHAAAQDLGVAVGFRRDIKQQLDHSFVPAIGDGAVGGVPGEQAGCYTGRTSVKASLSASGRWPVSTASAWRNWLRLASSAGI